jgi:hypothetical protein
MDLGGNRFAICDWCKEWDEAASFQHGDEGITRLFPDELKLLRFGRTDRNNHAACFSQLCKKWLRDRRSSSGSNNGVKWRVSRKALRAVTGKHCHVGISQAL